MEKWYNTVTLCPYAYLLFVDAEMWVVRSEEGCMIDIRQGQYSYVDTENAFPVIYLSCPLGKVKASIADM